MDSVSKHELRERCTSNDVKPLDDMYDIEEVAFIIKDLTHQIDLQKEYRKKKNKAISDEIKVLENKVDYFKKVIVSTLTKYKETKLTFAEACKISLRNSQPKWVIDDEEALIQYLIEENEIENCAEKVEGWKITKKDADKILNDWEKSETLPDSVHKELGEKGISISFLETEDKEPEEVNTTVPLKTDDFDELEW